MRVGSAPAPGSVMEKALRSVPSSRGSSHFVRGRRARTASIPIASSSALPESGALLPKTIGAEEACARGSRGGAPAAPGRSPSRRARGGGGRPTAPGASPPPGAGAWPWRRSAESRSRVSRGRISSSTKARAQASLASYSGSVSKSQRHRVCLLSARPGRPLPCAGARRRLACPHA